MANLVAVAYLKAMCEKLGIDRVNQADGRIDMRFALNAQVDGQKLFTALNGFDKRLTLNAAPPVTLPPMRRSCGPPCYGRPMPFLPAGAPGMRASPPPS